MLPIFEVCLLIYTTPHWWSTRFFVDFVVYNKVVKVVHFVIVDVVLWRSVIASNHQHVQCYHCRLTLSPLSFVNFCHFVPMSLFFKSFSVLKFRSFHTSVFSNSFFCHFYLWNLCCPFQVFLCHYSHCVFVKSSHWLLVNLFHFHFM